MNYRLIVGDCREVMRSMSEDSVDAIVTDPPAGIGFMGREWDSDKGGRDKWIAWLANIMRECLRVLKPGGHAVVWALPRTSHWTGMAIEDAGFTIRDVITHNFGSGFPKSLDISKAIDKRRDDDIRPVCRFLRAAMESAGKSSREIADTFGFNARMVDHWAARDTDSQPTCPTREQWERLRGMLGFGDDMDAEVWRLNGRKGQPGDAWVGAEVVGAYPSLTGGLPGKRFTARDNLIRNPATDDARTWEGWGTALKPSGEHWILARKPLGGTVAANVLKYGTGGLNVDACRVGYQSADDQAAAAAAAAAQRLRRDPNRTAEWGFKNGQGALAPYLATMQGGRWPANLLLSHSPDCDVVGERTVKGDPREGGGGTRPGGFGDVGAGRGSSEPNGALHGDETIPAYRCHPSCPVAELDRQSGERVVGGAGDATAKKCGPVDGEYAVRSEVGYGDTGGASRYFPTFAWEDADWFPFRYCAKPDRAERDAGLESLRTVTAGRLTGRREGSAGLSSPRAGAGRTSSHVEYPYAEETWVREALSRALPADTVTSASTGTAESMIRALDGSVWSMCWCGSPSTDPFHPAIRSIIETATSSTTESRTWKRSTQRHTNGCIAAVFGAMTHGGSLADCAGNSSPWALSTGISVEKGGPSTAAVVPVTSVESWLRGDDAMNFGVTIGGSKNFHNTVKPIALMAWLCRLVTPPGGTVLDPFAGSGTTLVAATRCGFNAIGIELNPEYAELIRLRVEEDAPLFQRTAPAPKAEPAAPQLGLALGGTPR